MKKKNVKRAAAAVLSAVMLMSLHAAGRKRRQIRIPETENMRLLFRWAVTLR